MQDKWDKRFMRVAREISAWSKDPSKQIGAVAVNDDRRILATGYNGFPKGIEDKTDAFRQEKFLNNIEVYPLKLQLKPIETKKRWNNLKTDPLIIDSFYVDCPEIVNSFYHEGTNKGVVKGTIYASIGEYIEKPIIQKSLDPLMTSISNEKLIARYFFGII